MPRQTRARIFSREFKEVAVQRMTAGEQVRAVATDLQVWPKLLYDCEDVRHVVIARLGGKLLACAATVVCRMVPRRVAGEIQSTFRRVSEAIDSLGLRRVRALQPRSSPSRCLGVRGLSSGVESDRLRECPHGEPRNRVGSFYRRRRRSEHPGIRDRYQRQHRGHGAVQDQYPRRGAYRLDIYRIGYYAGMGARRVDTVRPTIALPQ